MARRLLVTGDATVCNDIYRGTRDAPDSDAAPGTFSLREWGGCFRVHSILTELAQCTAPSGDEEIEVQFGLDLPSMDRMPSAHQRISLWEPGATKGDRVWQLSRSLGYGARSADAELYGQWTASVSGPVSTAVIVDEGLGFRSEEAREAWPSPLGAGKDCTAPADRFVLQLARVLGQGDLWHAIAENHCLNRTVAVVDINAVRSVPVRVSKGVSWEQTATHVVRAFREHPALSRLLACAHVVVSVGCEGAVVFNTAVDNVSAHLVFDSSALEGEWSAPFGVDDSEALSCLTAALAYHLSDGMDSVNAVKRGLAAMRQLCMSGHGAVTKEGTSASGFPSAEIAERILEAAGEAAFGSAPIPLSVAERGGFWTISESQCDASLGATGMHAGLARRIALKGLEAVRGIPYLKVGNLVSVDREEIERLGSLRTLMLRYRDSGSSKPLCFGVFGPPGAGKSFAVEELAEGVFGKKAVEFLVFNLSQFDTARSEELAGAFHQVRDAVLSGKLPIVFWDEFDADRYFWLRYFLSPMNDGVFRQGELQHPIGKCVFIFAGATSRDKAHFGPSPSDAGGVKDYVLKKGPDFISRLAGHLDVLGPNQRRQFNDKTGQWDRADATDSCAPVRRILALRGMLRVDDSQPLNIDHGLLTALLEIDEYRFGNRSLSRLCEGWREIVTRRQIGPSDLPPEDALSLHVDLGRFTALLTRDQHFQTLAEALAPAVHNHYLASAKAQGEAIHPDYDVHYDELPADAKESNEIAAQRIPLILSLVGLRLVPESSSAPELDGDTVRALLEEHIEVLAEVEHDGWVAHKKQGFWQYGTQRDERARFHRDIRPFDDLAEREKQKDRDIVRAYPETVAGSGYRIAACQQAPNPSQASSS